MANPAADTAAPVPYIIDVTLATFDTEVIARSHATPVLVDFWAAWCGPCQVLMPLLSKIAREYAGKFVLAKVNTDEEQKLAGAHGIRGLPTVKLFRNGKAVGEFSGAQPEKTIRALLDAHIPRESDVRAEAALAEYRAGRIEAGLTQLRAALAGDAKNDRVRLRLAQALIEQGHEGEAEEVLRGLSIAGAAQPEAAAVMARLEFARIAGKEDVAALRARHAQAPDDLAVRYRLGAALVLQGEHEAGLEQFLEILRRDRRFQDGAAHKAVLAAFNLLGNQGDLVKRYRVQLSLALN